VTKVRAPLTFAAAIHIIADLIGYDACAHLTDRSERTVREWSDSDKTPLPTLDQARALDLAFMEAGGGYAPILESYQRQIDVARCEPVACRELLAQHLGAASREFGDAWAHALQALQPGATPAQIQRAIVEIEEADGQLPPILGLLQALLLGNGIGSEATGKPS